MSEIFVAILILAACFSYMIYAFLVVYEIDKNQTKQFEKWKKSKFK